MPWAPSLAPRCLQYQRMTWDALRKSINGLVNKVNASNIKHILPEVFAEVGAAVLAVLPPCRFCCCCCFLSAGFAVQLLACFCCAQHVAPGQPAATRLFGPSGLRTPTAARALPDPGWPAAELGARSRPVLPFHHEEPDGVTHLHPWWVPVAATCRCAGGTFCAAHAVPTAARFCLSCTVRGLPRVAMRAPCYEPRLIRRTGMRDAPTLQCMLRWWLW